MPHAPINQSAWSKTEPTSTDFCSNRVIFTVGLFKSGCHFQAFKLFKRLVQALNCQNVCGTNQIRKKENSDLSHYAFSQIAAISIALWMIWLQYPPTPPHPYPWFWLDICWNAFDFGPQWDGVNSWTDSMSWHGLVGFLIHSWRCKVKEQLWLNNDYIENEFRASKLDQLHIDGVLDWEATRCMQMLRSWRDVGDGLVTLYASLQPTSRGKPCLETPRAIGKGDDQETHGDGTLKQTSGDWGWPGASLREQPRTGTPRGLL